MPNLVLTKSFRVHQKGKTKTLYLKEFNYTLGCFLKIICFIENNFIFVDINFMNPFATKYKDNQYHNTENYGKT